MEPDGSDQLIDRARCDPFVSDSQVGRDHIPQINTEPRWLSICIDKDKRLQNQNVHPDLGRIRVDLINRCRLGNVEPQSTGEQHHQKTDDSNRQAFIARELL